MDRNVMDALEDAASVGDAQAVEIYAAYADVVKRAMDWRAASFRNTSRLRRDFDASGGVPDELFP